ncbi:MAG: heme ABC transporter ATP-binding protein [Actinomycetales bacterium]|nr:heme ABC transporter ATP-binding protein [Actinomycetales bacterium]
MSPAERLDADPVAGPASEPAVLRARDAGLELGGRTVLDGVDLEIRAGEVLAIVGPNGAGKSSLLAMLSGERAPSRGAVELDGRPLASFSPVELAQRRAMLTQDNALSFPFRVREVIEMGRSPWQRAPERERDEGAMISAAARADVTHLLHRRFTELSGGERARVSLARVLAQDTPVVILDEPTAALDLRHQEDVLRVARALAAIGGAVVVVLHDLSLAGSVADRVALLAAGRLLAVGAPREVLTAESVGAVYRIEVDVIEHRGRLLVVPADPRARPE